MPANLVHNSADRDQRAELLVSRDVLVASATNVCVALSAIVLEPECNVL